MKRKIKMYKSHSPTKIGLILGALVTIGVLSVWNPPNLNKSAAIGVAGAIAMGATLSLVKGE